MKHFFAIIALLSFTGCGGSGGDDDAPSRKAFSELGKKIFSDTSLSSPKGLSCAGCHDSTVAFTDPSHAVVSNGAAPGSKGIRNAPTVMYSQFSPVFSFSADEGDFIGGQFWDGSAANQEAQAKKPLFSGFEMNLAGAEELRERILEADYLDEFKALYGEEVINDTSQTLEAVVNALSAFENDEALRPFTSKYDAWAEGKAVLSDQEMRGLVLFNAPNKGNCAACHPSSGEDGSGRGALFTDFTYDNVGLPPNSEANVSADIGLYKTTGRPSDIGRFKVPTLRNVEVTAPYFHHGWAKTLKDAVHFYNARDIDSSIGSAEFPDNMNITELGNLGLTSDEEEDIVAFLRTLTDGYYKRK